MQTTSCFVREETTEKQKLKSS